MYGLIHRAIRDCVIAEFGEDSWSKISETASLDESMLSTQLSLKSSKVAKQNIVYFPNSSGEMIAFDVKEK